MLFEVYILVFNVDSTQIPVPCENSFDVASIQNLAPATKPYIYTYTW